jgi:ribosomal protein S18 acetylase RimI-like enzyme
MTTMNHTITLEPIAAKNVVAFKAVRLAALSESPTAFGSTYADESQLAAAQWIARAARRASEANIGYLAIDGGGACGLVRGELEDGDASVAWVVSIWVMPSHRRSGIGRMLVCGVLAWARGQNLRGLKLEVTSGNEPAIRFYESLGFSLTGKCKPHPRDVALRECEMLLALR